MTPERLLAEALRKARKPHTTEIVDNDRGALGVVGSLVTDHEFAERMLDKSPALRAALAPAAGDERLRDALERLVAAVRLDKRAAMGTVIEARRAKAALAYEPTAQSEDDDAQVSRSEPFDEADNMCPNCVTPWKCNGPHLFEQTAASLAEALRVAK